MSEGASKAPLVVAIDFRQPQSYLAKGPTMKLAAALGVAVDWQPVEARPFEEPPAAIEGEDRGARHRRFRAHYFERDLARYAEAQGLVLRGLHRAPDASVAGIGLLWVKKHAGAPGAAAMVDHYVDSVFDGYWGETLELDDAAAIRGVLARVGAPASSFDPAAMGDEYEGVLARWRAAGVFGAPTYIVGDDLFIGRAHLPMIEWIWNGRVGPPPI
jgi:2-hydroxychromene-2-carboxylate isomerase